MKTLDEGFICEKRCFDNCGVDIEHVATPNIGRKHRETIKYASSTASGASSRDILACSWAAEISGFLGGNCRTNSRQTLDRRHLAAK